MEKLKKKPRNEDEEISENVTEEELQEALQEQEKDPPKPLIGTILFRKKLASKIDIETALSYQGRRGKDAKLVQE